MTEPHRCRYPDEGCVLVARVEMSIKAISQMLVEFREDFKEERLQRRSYCAEHEKRLNSLERWRTGLAYVWTLVVVTFAIWKTIKG